LEDVVAVTARTTDGRAVAFLTWGRLWDPVDESKLLEVLAAKSSSCAGAPMTDFKVCKSLGEASQFEYFYEGLLYFARRPIPFGDSYKSRRKDKAAGLAQSGADLYFLGTRI